MSESERACGAMFDICGTLQNGYGKQYERGVFGRPLQRLVAKLRSPGCDEATKQAAALTMLRALGQWVETECDEVGAPLLPQAEQED